VDLARAVVDPEWPHLAVEQAERLVLADAERPAHLDRPIHHAVYGLGHEYLGRRAFGPRRLALV
jgi:hypothetical protein